MERQATEDGRSIQDPTLHYESEDEIVIFEMTSTYVRQNDARRGRKLDEIVRTIPKCPLDRTFHPPNPASNEGCRDHVERKR